jgi:ParB family chromosome partitioning protein
MDTKKREKPRHLGRGLQSLLGPIIENTQAAELDAVVAGGVANFPQDRELRGSLREVSIASILPNPYQPRTSWNEQDLTELADSIRVNGVVQPIVVRPAGSGYEVIAGERRIRAAKEAGLETIPAIVRQATDQELLELALVENIHRSGLNPIERAKAYQKYLEAFSLTQVEAAERLGENRSVIANYIRLLELPDEIRQMLVSGDLSMGHARAILALPTDDLRRKLANRAMAGRLSVREVERLVRLYLQGGVDGSRKVKYKAPHILELETRLSRHLGTRVTIVARKNGQRGRIMIEFGSLDEFDRISEQLGLELAEEV